MNHEYNPSSFPSNFKYRTVIKKGKPVHHKNDSFSIRHPSMELSKRAKIFSPFDALKGFGDELTKAEQNVAKDCKERSNEYCSKRNDKYLDECNDVYYDECNTEQTEFILDDP